MTTRRISAAGMRMLLVEDDFRIAKAMTLVLQAEGIDIVGPVGTVKDALALIAQADAIDVALLDINLRGETVYPVADALRSKGVRFLFITGYDVTSVKHGYADVITLQKPVNIERLLEALFG